MISRLSRRSLFCAVMSALSSRLSSGLWSPGNSRPDHHTRGSGGAKDVDHEHQRIGALDAGLLVAGLAVAELGRDREHDPGADRDPFQRLVPALDDLAGADAERGGCALTAEVLVEGLVTAEDLAE